MKRKNNIKSLLIKNYFGKYNELLVFLILIIGVIIPTISYSPNNNFWLRLFNIYTNPFFQISFFIALGFNTFSVIENISKRYEIISRFHNYRNFISFIIKKIIISTLYLLLINFILASAGAYLFCLGNIQFLEYTPYQISFLFYLLFFLIRMIIITCLLNAISYLIYLFSKKISMISFILIECILIYFANSKQMISHFYQFNMNPFYYFTEGSYSSLPTELMCSIIIIFFLFIIIKILKWLIFYFKKDVVS